ncbi:hypothetical protein SEMRO_1139_G245390.1 [Seminavis robusta]|uniref:Uncharacterized protein n=1 Tax=Seminavis robusta TaxID=568900 RepID=A0A9N8HS67_9STRA|nr:hypothetical protein SEMRO_1139_G245390.1 [Seminavis robusta]|eukprot:Sro1139_g245390.1 n/a (363) ;mRNA; r:148-1343
MSIRSYDPINDFLHSPLTPIKGEPTRETIKLLITENKDNARQVHSARGTASEGHLRTCYRLNDYNARAHMAPTPWVDPVHPGARANIAVGATAAQIQRAVSEHQYDLQEFQIFQATERALLKLAMNAIEEVYYKGLKDPDEGYTMLHYMDLIEHLQEQFAFARGHDNITDRAALRAGLKNLEDSGVFNNALKEWRQKPSDDQTWATFQTFFLAANKERLRTVTTKDAGYHDQHRANAAGKSFDNPYLIHFANGEPMSYCFSHGFQWDLTHNSKTCRNRHPEHNEKARGNNMMGGRCQVKRKPGELPIVKYQPAQRNSNGGNGNRTRENGSNSANHSERTTDRTDRTTTTTETDVSSLSTQQS